MAQISLRLYDREIESLIDRGQIDEAISHCKYILKTYPKHIETYRLLGKCFLESQRYIEAADILQRVLTVYPDDFISHIGMSIISEDENNLEKAIWHMDRALEVQPSNSAVNSELRRLLTLKDGAEPSKVHLSQGAYIRMCVKSGLHEQAIAEAKSALAKEPQRVDLEVILAKMYSELGQSSQAMDQWTIILNKISFCYEANLSMTQILIASNRTEEAKTYQQRLIAIDPYYAFINAEFPSPDLVPDDSVLIERIEWQESDDDTQRHTKILGVDWQETKGPLASSGVTTKSFNQDSLPTDLTDEDMIPAVETMVKGGLEADSVNQLGSDDNQKITQELSELKQEASVVSFIEPAQVQTVKENPSTPPAPIEEVEQVASEEVKEEIPDWMKSAGWVQSSGESEGKPNPDDAISNEPVQSADIPDWIKNMAPPEPEPSEIKLTEESEKLKLLNKILPENETSQDQFDVHDILPQPLESTTEQLEVISFSASSDETADSSFGTSSVSEVKESIEQAVDNTNEAEEIPDWLKKTSDSELPSNDSAVEKPEVEALPVWMSVGEDLEQEKLEFPDQKSLADQVEQVQQSPEQFPAGEVIPDWMSSTSSQDSGSINDTYEISTPDQISQEFSQSSETFPGQNLPSDSTLDWLQQEPVLQTGYIPAEDEIIPEWLRDEQTDTSRIGSADNNQMPDITVISSSSLIPETQQSEQLLAEVDSTEIPDWLKEVNTEQSPGLSLEDEDILPDWAKPVTNAEPESAISPEIAFESFIESAVIPEETLVEPPIAETPMVAEEVQVVQMPEELSEENPSVESMEGQGLDSLLDQLSQGDYSYSAPAQIEDSVSPAEESIPIYNSPDITNEEKEVEESPFIDENSDVVEEIRDDETLISKPFIEMEKDISEPITSSNPVLEEHVEEAAVESEPLPVFETSEGLDAFDSDLGQISPPSFVETSSISDIPLVEQELPDDTLDVTSDIDIESWLNSLADVNPDQVTSSSDEAPVTYQEPVFEEGISQVAIPEEQQFKPLQPTSVDTAPLVAYEEEQVRPPEASPLDELEEAGHFRSLTPVQETIGILAIEEKAEETPPSPVIPENIVSEIPDQPQKPQTYEELLIYANSSVVEGNLDGAVQIFNTLIKSGSNLDEVIQSLRSAVYRHPADVMIWQTLGDGYARNNRLQEALDAYTKAEELLL